MTAADPHGNDHANDQAATMRRAPVDLVAKDEDGITVQITLRDAGDDELVLLVLRHDDVPEWVRARPLGWRGYARATVQASTQAGAPASARLDEWEHDLPSPRLWVVAFTQFTSGWEPGTGRAEHRTMLVPTDNTFIAHTPQAALGLFTQWLGVHEGARVFGPYPNIATAQTIAGQPWLWELDSNRRYVHTGGQPFSASGATVPATSLVLVS